MLPAVLFLIPKAVLITAIKKFVSIGVYTKEALDFFCRFSHIPPGKDRGIRPVRFIEQGKNVIFEDISGSTLSVDTPKDLERIREQFEDRKRNEK